MRILSVIADLLFSDRHRDVARLIGSRLQIRDCYAMKELHVFPQDVTHLSPYSFEASQKTTSSCCNLLSAM
jgi:hypothetical protein